MTYICTNYKYMEKTRKTTKVVCDNCGIEFEKATSEVKRGIEKGKRSFCSRRCVGLTMASNISGLDRSKIVCTRGGNKYSGFREFIRRAKNRHHEYNIDLDYLIDLWNKQEGKCIYTGISMVLPHGVTKGTPFTASLDRIDSSIGYMKGNVQYTITPINYMKNSMTHSETLELIQLIKTL